MENTYSEGILEKMTESIENGTLTYKELTKDSKSVAKISNGKINLTFDLNHKEDVEILRAVVIDGFGLIPRVDIDASKKSEQVISVDVSNIEGLAKVADTHCKNYFGAWPKE